MKRLFALTAVVLAAATATATAPAIAADVAVSVSIGEPGFYGRIDLGGFPPPQVIYRRPLVVERVTVEREPVYLRVPPGHAKHWSKHCREYGACGERVYFVKDDWYQREYAPRYRERYYDRDGRRDDRREHREWQERRDNGRGHDRGHDRDR